MTQPVDERIKQLVEETRVAIDDYLDTIRTIIGFVNLYLLDEKHQPRLQVKGFQGRRLTVLPIGEQSIQPNISHDVCPDLGIVIGDEKGILGEVKKNFPKEDLVRGNKIFLQIKSYDQNLIGWPVPSQQVKSHELVLLVHLTTSANAKEFYEEHLPGAGIVFERPFSVVEFGRQEQVQPFFFFRTVLGEITEIGEEKKLKYGVSVPMRVLVHEYAKTRLYDAQPPVPYLAELIWSHVCTPIVSEDPKFEHLRRRQRIQVSLSIEDIVEKLDEGFSFRFWHSQYPERQPHVPRTEWVKQVCQFLVESGEAEWVKNTDETQLTFSYQRYDDPLQHFVSSYATLEEKKRSQPMLPNFGSTGITGAG